MSLREPHVRDALWKVGRFWAAFGQLPVVCRNGHGGHQIDAEYCRICGTHLQRRTRDA